MLSCAALSWIPGILSPRSVPGLPGLVKVSLQPLLRKENPKSVEGLCELCIREKTTCRSYWVMN